jgi:hypothetical protein
MPSRDAVAGCGRWMRSRRVARDIAYRSLDRTIAADA